MLVYKNMSAKKISSYVCCSIDISIACRIIGFIGISISVLLITVLLNDKFINKNTNYEVSRKTALAFGLDWQHFHPETSTAYHDDPDGSMISIIVVFYSLAFLLINLLLFFATIKHDWRYTIPWLTCEFFGCLSKFGALIFHIQCDPQYLSTTFIVGSIIYIVTMVWWWIVVYSAQSSWKVKDKSGGTLEMSAISLYGAKQNKDYEESLSGKIRFIRDVDKLDSPVPYFPNSMYALI